MKAPKGAVCVGAGVEVSALVLGGVDACVESRWLSARGLSASPTPVEVAGTLLVMLVAAARERLGGDAPLLWEADGISCVCIHTHLVSDLAVDGQVHLHASGACMPVCRWQAA